MPLYLIDQSSSVSSAEFGGGERRLGEWCQSRGAVCSTERDGGGGGLDNAPSQALCFCHVQVQLVHGQYLVTPTFYFILSVTFGCLSLENCSLKLTLLLLSFCFQM